MLNGIDNGERSMIIAPRALKGGDVYVQMGMIGVVGDTVKAGELVAIIHRLEIEMELPANANQEYYHGQPIAWDPGAADPADEYVIVGDFTGETETLVTVGFLSRDDSAGVGETRHKFRVQIRG